MTSQKNISIWLAILINLQANGKKKNKILSVSLKKVFENLSS